MNIQNFNKKLQKIAALTDNLQSDIPVSVLERDLILGYIRELYDIALDDRPAPAKPVMKVAQEEISVKMQVEEKQPEQAQVIIAPKVEIQPITPEPVPHTIVAEVITKEPPKPIEHPRVPEVKPVTTATPNDDVMAEIFADEKITDLSDRLSLSHITDLTKSMGINERVFTQQELFGNDQGAFNEIMSSLNQFKSFEEAKQYLLDHVVIKYGWMNENKAKKAATFVRHIKRKYI